MVIFEPNQCNIETTIPKLKGFAIDTHKNYYKRYHLKRWILNRERYPRLKITEDIFSLVLWLRAKNGEEQRIFLDGDVFLNRLTIHTITINGTRFSEHSFLEMNRFFKKLTKLGNGYIAAEVNHSPVKYENGKMVQDDDEFVLNQREL